MTGQAEQVLAAALDLPPTERAALVEAILASFEFPARASVDATWSVEVEERIDAFERGELPAIEADRLFDRIDRGRTP